MVLIARNQQKLLEVKNSIIKLYPSIDVQIIVFDFGKTGKGEHYEPIKKFLEKLDIAILVNNVGMIYFHKFHEISDANLEEVINIDELSYIYMAKIVVPLMLKRQGKSSIMMISSGFSHSICTNTSSHAIAKSGVNSLCKSLAIEYSDKIDICCFDIGKVTTKANPKINAGHITTEA